MKFSELPIKNIRDVKDLDAYMICNAVDHDSDNVNNISKSLIHISNFAHKEEVNALVEQNQKLVEIVSSLVNKNQLLESAIEAIKNNQQNHSANEDLESLNEQIEMLKQRLDDNLIEI